MPVRVSEAPAHWANVPRPTGWVPTGPLDHGMNAGEPSWLIVMNSGFNHGY